MQSREDACASVFACLITDGTQNPGVPPTPELHPALQSPDGGLGSHRAATTAPHTPLSPGLFPQEGGLSFFWFSVYFALFNPSIPLEMAAGVKQGRQVACCSFS